MKDGFYSNNPLNLNIPLVNNRNLKSYYESLPEYLKKSIKSCHRNIESEEDLRDCVEKLLKNR